MEEKDYCSKCDMYTNEKVETIDQTNTELWHCPVCNKYKQYPIDKN